MYPSVTYHGRPAQAMSRPRILIVVLSLVTLASLLYYCCTTHAGHTAPACTPANSTLGFGAIFAVSPHYSPRRPSLLCAANLTGLDIVIPDLPSWSVRDVEAFKAKDRQSTISVGSAKAWLGHLEILKEYATKMKTQRVHKKKGFSLNKRRKKLINTQLPSL